MAQAQSVLALSVDKKLLINTTSRVQQVTVMKTTSMKVVSGEKWDFILSEFSFLDLFFSPFRFCIFFYSFLFVFLFFLLCVVHFARFQQRTSFILFEYV